MPIIPIKESNFLYEHIYQAISEPKRIQILYALSEQPLNVTALAQALDTPQPTVSRHLAVLRIITILDLIREVLREALIRKSSAVCEWEDFRAP